MIKEKIFLAATGDTLSRAEYLDGGWQLGTVLSGKRVNCLAYDPSDPRVVFAGTQGDGVLFSGDAGLTWTPSGLQGRMVKSLAVSPHDPKTIYAGCKPVSLYVSRDGGRSWEEYPGLRRAKKWWWFSPAEPPDWRAYPIALTVSPSDPEVMMAGIEFGGILRSADGGRSWSKHPRGALLDCHSLTFHAADGGWVYQGGAGGASVSQDGGLTWRKPRAGLKKRYGWMVAADPLRPEVWYLSSSRMPSLLRGEFEPPGHVDGKAGASIYRSIGGAAWEPLGGGLPEPLDFMPYALVTDPERSGNLYAGLANGDVWHTTDYGDSWVRLPFSFEGIHRSMIIL